MSLYSSSLPPRPRAYTVRPGRRPDRGVPAIHLAEHRRLDPTARTAPTLLEGEIYEGAFSITGGEGPTRRWIVVAPEGKSHIHSMDDPGRVNCWPLNALIQALAVGRAQRVGFEPEHAMVRLQRAKERSGIRDAHLRLDSAGLAAMMNLLEEALAAGADYAANAAAEIRAHLAFSVISAEERAAMMQRLERLSGPAAG